MESSDIRELMAERLGGPKSEKVKPKLHMRMHQLDDGKFLVEHEMHGGDYSEPANTPKKFAPADLKALHDHIDTHYGEPKPEPVLASGAGVEIKS